MLYRRLDEEGDYSFGEGQMDYGSGDNAIAQAIRTKLSLFYGEWFEDVSVGLPMFQSILGQTSNDNLRNTIVLLVRERLQSIPEIKTVNNVEVLYKDRELMVNVTCTTAQNTEVETEVLWNGLLPTVH